MGQIFLQRNRLIEGGKMTDLGWEIFSDLLNFVGQLPCLTPGFPKSPYDIFEKFMSKVVPVAVELVLIRQGKVFLTWREDNFFRGWHFPGGFISPRETLIKTCQRIADRETPGLSIISVDVLDIVNNTDDPRFHCVSLIVKAQTFDEPQSDHGCWFSEKPADLIEIHQPIWQKIKTLK